jgi:hypothetical protein|nr:MAG TPA: hypothetical protein [Caudoviricetes sp.]
MIDIKDLKVGQTLYLVRKGYEGNVHKEELDRVLEVKVVKAGRRYVTVNTYITTETFDSQEDFKIYNNYGYMKMKCGLYLCAKDYIDELILISRAENAVINGAGDSVFTGQAKEVIVNLVRLKRATGKAKRG